MPWSSPRIAYPARGVSVRSDGNRRWYRARADRLAELRAMLDRFWGGKLAALQAEFAPAEREPPP